MENNDREDRCFSKIEEIEEKVMQEVERRRYQTVEVEVPEEGEPVSIEAVESIRINGDARKRIGEGLRKKGRKVIIHVKERKPVHMEVRQTIKIGQ